MSGTTLDVADDDGMARELLAPSKQERTAHWTHCACTAARLLFLFSHGVLALCVSSALDNIDEASWWILFLPVWIGDILCAALIVSSWFVSCPYIKFCLEERSQRRGMHNPSILTEILPEILMAVLGLLFLIMLFVGEYSVCSYLDSAQHGHPHSLAAVVILLGLASGISICHGVCVVHNSVIFIVVGCGVFSTVVIFAATRESDPTGQAFCLTPAIGAVMVLIVAVVRRFYLTSPVLVGEERVLRFGEIALLVVLLGALLSVGRKVQADLPAEASTHGSVAGASLCLVALLRGRMCCLELWQPVHERMLSHERTVASASASVHVSCPTLVSIC